MKPRNVLAATTCLLAVTLLTAPAQADPPAGTEWVPFAPMTDEFDGDRLDATKWRDRNPTWKGREPAFFHRDCVSVGDGKLKITMFNETESAKRGLPGGFTHVSGYVLSKAECRFGYFEMRAKLMDSTLVSCFWLNNHERSEWSEIDIVEIPAGVEKYASLIQPNTHYFFGPHYRGSRDTHLVDKSVHELPFQHKDDFHVYGCEWNATHIRWFVDGKMIRESENTMFYQPLKLNMNLEANHYLDAMPDDDHMNGQYEIDWVRAWRPKVVLPKKS